MRNAIVGCIGAVCVFGASVAEAQNWVVQNGANSVRVKTTATGVTIRQDGTGNVLCLKNSAGTDVWCVSKTGLVTASGLNALATTSTDGLVLQNLTPSNGTTTVQISPRLRWTGTAYDTATSQTVSFFSEVLPATAATPTGTWKLGYSLNGATATYPLTVTSAGGVTALGSADIGGELKVGAGNAVYWNGRAVFTSANDGSVNITNQAATIGSRIKVDALPTVASGFGTSPAITAGSTPLAGSVNIGTGGVATSGVINFNGTAFPSAPFCVAGPATSNTLTRASATSTTQLTLTTTVAWGASDIVSWICISSKS